MTWDSSIAMEFAEEVKEAVKEKMEEYGTDDPYTCAEEIGRAILNLLYETYGAPEEW